MAQKVKARKEKFSVTVLLLQEEGKWVAQCLEHDIAAQADTIKGVQQAFVKAFASQACVNIHHGKKPMEDVPPAPAVYRKSFKQALKVQAPVLPGSPFVDVQAKEMAVATA